MSERRGGIEEAISFGFHLGLSVASTVVSKVVISTAYGLSELNIGKKK